MDKTIKVNYHELTTKDFLVDTSLLTISESFQSEYEYPILIAKVDNDITSLNEVVSKKCDVDFFDRSSLLGNAVYESSLQFILVLAVKRLFGDEIEVVIEHSMDKGFYCEILKDDIGKVDIKKLSDVMQEIVNEDLVYNKVNVLRFDAIKYFKKKKQMDKVNVLKYISNSYINLHHLNNVYDYFFGELAYSTKSINDFKLTYIKDNGFVVSFPDIYNPVLTLDYTHHKMIFDEFLNYTKWGRDQGITNAADLNAIISTGKIADLVRLAEAHYDRQLSIVADNIYDNHKEVKIVLIAGPSSSGKTTSSKKLEVYLGSRGLKTHQISIDDYFYNRDETPKCPDGELDLESINAVDLNLFNRHLMKLLDGEKVLLPEYNFMTGRREYRKKSFQMGDNDIIIIEGLHALNEELTMSIERKSKYKIYISPLTQLNIDNHNRIHTSDARKLRRIIRDNKYRGYNAADTLKMWNKIREGEEKYIFPYQDDADVIINSALIYELGVLKTYAEPLLFSVEESDENYPEALRLINFLRNFLPIPSDDIPEDSVVREFIGGSCFKD